MTDEQYIACELVETELDVADWLVRVSRAYLRGDFHLWKKQRELITEGE